MHFEYSDEQRMLGESVGRLLAGREDGHASDGGDGIWSAYADLGLLGMMFDEDDGGLGMSPVETLIVMRAIGKGLCRSPYLASAVYGSALLKAAASAEQKAALVPDLVSGTAQLAVAHAEPGSRYSLIKVEASAVIEGDRAVLSGNKTLVLGGATATHFVVSAQLAGNGIGLFLVPVTAEGLTVQSRRTIDGRTADDLSLDAVRIPLASMLASGQNALDALEEATHHAVAATVNEAVGAMEELLALTVDYLKTRRQFAAPIGSFQALQHKAVDMFIEVEQAKSMGLYAAMQLDLPAQDRRNAIALSKVHVNRAARFVGETAVQLHGAIGMTMESKTGRLFNRLTACQIMFGDSDFWLASLIETTPDILAA